MLMTMNSSSSMGGNLQSCYMAVAHVRSSPGTTTPQVQSMLLPSTLEYAQVCFHGITLQPSRYADPVGGTWPTSSPRLLIT